MPTENPPAKNIAKADELKNRSNYLYVFCGFLLFAALPCAFEYQQYTIVLASASLIVATVALDIYKKQALLREPVQLTKITEQFTANLRNGTPVNLSVEFEFTPFSDQTRSNIWLETSKELTNTLSQIDATPPLPTLNNLIRTVVERSVPIDVLHVGVLPVAPTKPPQPGIYIGKPRP
jgi:hypothetical protein